MPASRIHLVLLAAAIAAGIGLPLVAASCADRHPVEAGFWFDDLAFESQRLGGSLTPDDLRVIQEVARHELTRAFHGLNLSFTDRRDARYRVQVVQRLRDPRLRRVWAVAGASRAMAGFGGSGAVNFEMLASSALAYAPPRADRSVLLAAIGRGVGRAAVHEFVHQLLPKAPIHASTDLESYEYESAARRQQYYGDMHWSVAWPLLEARLGTVATDTR